jgi:hypothetical protein
MPNFITKAFCQIGLELPLQKLDTISAWVANHFNQKGITMNEQIDDSEPEPHCCQDAKEDQADAL